MHRLHDLSELPEDLGPCVVTVGNFDGVHRGHQEVLGMVVERARREGASSVVLTFDPHPALVHRPDQYRGRIMGTSDKLDAMEQLGVDAVLVLRLIHPLRPNTTRRCSPSFLLAT